MFQTDPLSLDPSFPQMRQLRDVDINRASADARLSAALRRAGTASPRPSSPTARPARPAPADSSLEKITPLPAADADHAARRRRSAPPGHAGKWDAALPLPPAYERLADVFVALQQVGPLLRKRQQACTADIVCASVETMTGRVLAGDAALGGGCAAGDGVLQRARRRERVRPGERTDVPAARPGGRRRSRRLAFLEKRRGRVFASRQFPQRRRTPRASPRGGSAPRSSRWWARDTTRSARAKRAKGNRNSSPRAGPSSREAESERVANDSRDARTSRP